MSDDKVIEVSEFYKKNPFPNYKIDDDKVSILEKGNKNILAREFKKFVGYNKKVLEIGCGTGQLSIFFSIGNNNSLFALDATMESLKIAKNFSEKNYVNNIKFIHADIFDDVFRNNYFDFIWCNGVLHHTKKPYESFSIISKYLKKNGFILIGLYNKYGRLRTIIRKYFFKFFGKSFIKLFDPTIKNLKISKAEEDAWIQDQYKHPQESLHTIDEVLDWFNNNNIEFISSIPSCEFDNYDYNEIFSKKNWEILFIE